MQTKLKTLIGVADLMLATIFIPTAQAQVPTYAAQGVLTSYIVTGGNTSNSIAGVIDCRKQQNVGLQWVATGSTNQLMSLSASVDGTTFDTNHWVIANFDATSGPGTIVTNLAVTGFGYVRVDRMTSTGTINGTNTVKYGVKINSP